MNDLDIEQSFFKLCDFQQFNTIYHNLYNWNLNFDGWENKAGQIETNIIIPYSEMELELYENSSDINFFNKYTVRIKIKINKDKQNYIFHEKIKCTFNEKVQYILLDTKFISPHNWYYLYNRDYLSNKIIFSIDYINNFLEGYRTLFNTNIPLLFIKKITETSTEFIFDIIIKEYLNIFYVSTDINTQLIMMNLVIDKNYQKEKNIKYKNITFVVPRLVKNKKNNFKFITGFI